MHLNGQALAPFLTDIGDESGGDGRYRWVKALVVTVSEDSGNAWSCFRGQR